MALTEAEELEMLELEEAEANSVSSVSKQEPIQSASAKTEALMTERPNNIRSLTKDPSTINRLLKHPVGTSLRTIGGAFDYLEGFPASIAIDLQNGTPQNILKNLTKVATGERVPQRGDILRNIGIDEFTSSTVGLLAGGAKLSPDTALGKILFQNPVINKVGDVISKVGVQGLSKAMSITSGVPQNKVVQALNNPNFLSKSWLSKSEKIIQQKYKTVAEPLINDNTKRINTSSLANISEELGIIQKNGDYTKAFTGMKKSEQKMFLNWEKKIFNNKLSFNDADALKGEIDSALDSTWKAKNAGRQIDYSDDFVRNATQFREKLNGVIKFQYPEFGKVLDEYSMVKTAKGVFSNFDKWIPKFLPAMAANATAMAVGAVHNPVLFGAATLGAIPKVQATGVRIGGAIGKTLNSIPSGVKAEGMNRLLDDSKN